MSRPNALEAGRLQSALEHKLWESELQSQEYLQYADSTRIRHRLKAEEALEYQKQGFVHAAQQYEQQARDICQLEVAQTRTNLEADALNLLSSQSAELGVARQAVGQLRQALHDVQNAAITNDAQQRSCLLYTSPSPRDLG